MNSTKLKHILFDWGDTLMSEDGPQDYTMADWPEVHAIDGALETLRELSQRYCISIATNATISKRADIERALQRVGLASFISHIFCYTEIGHRKDEPVFWSHVLAKLNAEPDEALMIGDSLAQDVLSPRRAGIAAIWFNWKNTIEIAPSDVIAIHSLHELPAFIFKLIQPNLDCATLLQTLWTAFNQAWDRRDALALSALFTGEGRFLFFDGRLLEGKCAIETFYRNTFCGLQGSLIHRATIEERNGLSGRGLVLILNKLDNTEVLRCRYEITLSPSGLIQELVLKINPAP